MLQAYDHSLEQVTRVLHPPLLFFIKIFFLSYKKCVPLIITFSYPLFLFIPLMIALKLKESFICDKKEKREKINFSLFVICSHRNELKNK